MSTQDKKPPPVDWKTIERAAGEADRADAEERDRWLKMSDEQVDAELGAAGIDPAEAAALLKTTLEKADAGKAPASTPAPAPAPAKVLSLSSEREKRRRPIAWVTLVAAAAAVVVVGGGVTVVALNTPSLTATTPTPPVPSAPPGPSPEMLAKQEQQERQSEAEALRKQAREECDQQRWKLCGDTLAEASERDPAGDGARAVRRLRKKAERGQTEEMLGTKPGALAPRKIGGDGVDALVARLAPAAPQPVRLVCARSGEAKHLCDQLAGAMGKAGWIVTRAQLGADAGDVWGVRVEVSTSADDATQGAADLLADALESAYLNAHGPDDMAPGDEGALKLTIGMQ